MVKTTPKTSRLVGAKGKQDRPRYDRAEAELKMRLRERKILDAERKNMERNRLQHPFGKREIRT